MDNKNDVIRSVEEIRKAIEALNVQGYKNASIVVYVCNLCDNISKAIEGTSEDANVG